MPIDSYVNADVLIFNLKKIRCEKTLPDKAIEYLQKHQDTPFLEQDIFNSIFYDEKIILPSRYNTFSGLGFGKEWVETIISKENNSDTFSDYILHFAKNVKPWNEYVSKYDMEYWYYLSLTPWGKDGKVFHLMPQALASADDVIQDIDKYIWRYSLKEKIKKIWHLFIPLYGKIGARYLQDLMKSK